MKQKFQSLAAVAMVCAAMLTSFAAAAKSYSYSMQVTLKSGETVTYEVADVQKMNFLNGGDASVVIAQVSEQAVTVAVDDINEVTFPDADKIALEVPGDMMTYDLAEVTGITFTLATDGVATVAAGEDLTVAVAAGVITVSSAAGEAVNVCVYDMKGAVVATAAAAGCVTVDANTLPAGVYVLKANNQTVKFTR